MRSKLQKNDKNAKSILLASSFYALYDRIKNVLFDNFFCAVLIIQDKYFCSLLIA